MFDISLPNTTKGILLKVIDVLGRETKGKSTKNKHKGLGLGLFISKNLLGKNFGDIKFLNLKDQGGCVQILLSKKSLGL